MIFLQTLKALGACCFFAFLLSALTHAKPKQDIEPISNEAKAIFDIYKQTGAI